MTSAEPAAAQTATRLYKELWDRVAQDADMHGGNPIEPYLYSPFEELMESVARALGYSGFFLSRDARGQAEGAIPDYTASRDRLVVGHIELKAPGKGVHPDGFQGHDREQWLRLKPLPNLLYTDGIEWILWQEGQWVASAKAWTVEGGGIASAEMDPNRLVHVIDAFCSGALQSPKSPQHLAEATARLCRVLRDQILYTLGVGDSGGIARVAEEWRSLLFPEATDRQFADAYAQTITFGLIAARATGADFDTGDSVYNQVFQARRALGTKVGLMPTALEVLCPETTIKSVEPAMATLMSLLANSDPALLNDAGDWLYFYEDFLASYDPKLRKESGSYYTPAELVRFMVRLTDEVLANRLGKPAGFAEEAVTVIDPAVGTGGFLLQIIERIVSTVERSDGVGAVRGALVKASKRLIGFENQTGSYSVAQFRTGSAFRRHGAEVGPHVLLADTLANPYIEEEHLGSLYEPMSQERRSANILKKTTPVMVAIGNPPYRERAMEFGGWVVEGHREAGQDPILDHWKPPPDWGVGEHVFNMHNLLVYFWRWATWKVFENSGIDGGDRPGVVCFVTTAAWLSGAGFQKMRSWLREWCSEIWVVSLSPEGFRGKASSLVFESVPHEIAVVCATRSPSTDAAPADVWFREVSPGNRKAKFLELETISIADPGPWIECPREPRAPFKPAGKATWLSYPAIHDLLPWSSPGVSANRGWPTSPDPDTLKQRWRALITESNLDHKRALFKETRDRKTDRTVPTGLPGHPPNTTPISEETNQSCSAPVPLRWRSFDQHWIIPDKRVLDRPRPPLWEVLSDQQIHLTCIQNDHPRNGPAATFTHLLPGLDHYHGRGGRVFPLWRDNTATHPNITPGLLEHLIGVLDVDVAPLDLFAYIAAMCAHPAYTEWFNSVSAHTPGLRIPLPADNKLWSRAVKVGRRVIWAQTFGERCVNSEEDRPPGRIRLPDGPRLDIEIGEGTQNLNVDYHTDKEQLRIGDGVFTNVKPAVAGYEVSGKNVIRYWFNYRKTPRKRPPTLEGINPAGWRSDWDIELLDILNALTALVDVEPAQAGLLTAVIDGPQITTQNLTDAGLLPPPEEATKEPKVVAKTASNQTPLP